MNKRAKRAMALITAVAVAAMLIIKPGRVTITVKAAEAAEAIPLSTEAEFRDVINQLGTGDVNATLSANIKLTSSYSINAGTYSLTIDLNGRTLTDTNNTGLFNITGGTVAITDSSEAGTGKMVSGASTVINVTGGALKVEGGQIESTGSNGIAIDASDGSIEVKRGTLSGDFAALRIGDNCNVIIGADGGIPQFESSNAAVFMPENKQGSTLTIYDGVFNAVNSSSFCYSCNFAGVNSTLTITGGEFNLKAPSGSSLVIGE